MEDEKVYRCPICKRCYARSVGGIQVACCVMHAPGDCCHYGERELTAEEEASRVELIDDGVEVWRRALGW